MFIWSITLIILTLIGLEQLDIANLLVHVLFDVLLGLDVGLELYPQLVEPPVDHLDEIIVRCVLERLLLELLLDEALDVRVVHSRVLVDIVLELPVDHPLDILLDDILELRVEIVLELVLDPSIDRLTTCPLHVRNVLVDLVGLILVPLECFAYSTKVIVAPAIVRLELLDEVVMPLGLLIEVLVDDVDIITRQSRNNSCLINLSSVLTMLSFVSQSTATPTSTMKA